jgi:hypothetical protein
VVVARLAAAAQRQQDVQLSELYEQLCYLRQPEALVQCCAPPLVQQRLHELLQEGVPPDVVQEVGVDALYSRTVVHLLQAGFQQPYSAARCCAGGGC